MTQPTVTVVMPVYNTARYVEDAIDSVLAQSFSDFELLIIDDAGSDNSIELCRNYDDPRIRIISQSNRGLAGARNTGIRYATGQFIAFIDSDDLWEREKLHTHVAHLRSRPNVGVSYSGSQLIDDDGRPLRIVQSPKLRNIRTEDIFMRNPIGNGSAPVVRRHVLLDIAFLNEDSGEMDYFDQSFRQSEDIECWMRIALTSNWKFEGVRGTLTHYRINESGLSANVIRQFQTWCGVRDRVYELDANFAEKWTSFAEAFQLRYLARRCIRMGDGAMAWSLMKDAFRANKGILFREPGKTVSTLAAALVLRFMPRAFNVPLQAALQKG